MQTKRMRIHPLYDLKLKLRTDLGKQIGKNLLGKRLVRPMYKFAKSVTETSSKIRELKTYNKAINNLIHGNRW